MLWRWPSMNSPRNDSLAPLVYRLAVSMKLPPASRKALYTFCASSLAAPQPQSSPKVIVPSAASDTRSPEFPSSLYFIFSLSQFGFLPRDAAQLTLFRRANARSLPSTLRSTPTDVRRVPNQPPTEVRRSASDVDLPEQWAGRPRRCRRQDRRRRLYRPIERSSRTTRSSPPLARRF